MDSDKSNTTEEIISSIRLIEERVARLEQIFGSGDKLNSTQKSVKKLSIKEFIIELKPKNAVQMTLAIGYYLEHHDKIYPFNCEDIENGFRAAREQVPNNLNDKVNMCVSKGHLMEDEKKDNLKAWVLTRSGEDIIKNGFNKKIV
jgi:hypothetical protein